jgi:hypothetical protein
MVVVDEPPQFEASEMEERVKASVRAQTFLDVLQGAFQSTWGRPEALRQAMWEVSCGEEAKAGLCGLLSYVEALSPCLSRLCGVGGREGEAGAGRQGKGRRKRRKRAASGRGGGSVPSSGDEEETVPEQGLSPATLGQDDKRDTEAGEAGVVRGGEAGLVLSLDGLGRAGVPTRRSSMGQGRRESSVQGVLGDRDLLGCVLGFVGGQTGRQRVRALGQVALVSRLWREESCREGLWVGVEEEVVPALWREGQGGRVAVGRGRLVQYGRVLFAERRMWSTNDWAAGLELHVEIFDHMDGLQMLSAGGALGVEVQEEFGRTYFFLPPVPAVEVRGASFSAASRDPEQRRFANIDAYFDEGHESEYPCSLCVRLTVRDQRTGKGGLLWEEGKGTARSFQFPEPLWEERLPEGAMATVSRNGNMVGAGGEGFRCWTVFYVCPEPDQEGVAEEDMLYRVAMGEDDSDRDSYPFDFSIKSTDAAKVGSIIRSLC